MIDGQPVFVLPLVDHLVQQRRARGLEPVAPDVQRGDRDLARRAFTAKLVVAEPPAHPARDPEGHRSKGAAEVRRIQLIVPLGD